MFSGLTMNDLALTWLAAFLPPARPTIAEWARDNIILPDRINADPGPFVPRSYQRGLMDAVEHTETTVLMLASQVGKSAVLDAALLHSFAIDPGPALHVSPTDAKATDFLRDRLRPTIKASPNVATLLTNASSARVEFVGGTLNVASSFKPDDLAARAIRYLFADEIDRFASSSGREGDPLALAIRRTSSFTATRRIVIASTPTSKGASRIAEWFAKGTQERFFVPCPECGVFDYLRWSCVKWTEGKPETARYECDACASRWTDRQRREAVELGEWRATNDTPQRGVRSFHATALVSPFVTMADLALEHEQATTPDKLRVFFNTVLAEPFDAAAEAEVEAGDLMVRAVEVTQPLPAETAHITAGVDVQGNRVEITFMAHLTTGDRLIVDHVVAFGDTTGPEPWRRLDAILGTRFLIADGRTIAPSVTFVDGGFLLSTVADFVAAQRQRQRRAYTILGRGGFDRPSVKEGQRVKGKLRALILGVDSLKLQVLKEFQAGRLRLPNHLSSDYFDQLAAERLEVRFVRGASRMKWIKQDGARAEALDCAVYALAAGTMTKGIAQTVSTKSGPAKKTVAELANRLASTSKQDTDT